MARPPSGLQAASRSEQAVDRTGDGGRQAEGFLRTDKEKINGRENKWRIPIVPGSTLRGVIRSICEAVSNSSFTALNGKTLDYRLLPIQSNRLKCGIILEEADKDKNLEQLDKMEDATKPGKMIQGYLMGVAISGVFALIISLIMKKQKKVDFES